MSTWHEDRAGYPSTAWVTDPSLWAVAVLRFGQWAFTLPGPVRPVGSLLYALLYSVVRLVTGIDIPRSVKAGGGLRIYHFGGITFSPDVVLGARCVLRQGVTIGRLEEDGPSPVLGDDVFLGAYAQVLGPVKVGNGARIGALAVVLQDVPPGATAVGIPAKIIPAKD